MKSVYIIAGGILVMIAVVFLAPQKKDTIAEEKTSIPLDETESTILKEYGIDLSTLVPEDREMLRQQLVERLAREKAEIKKYGRVLTDEERYQLEWQAEVEEHQKAEFVKLYEERKDWIDNFPFQPRYHQNLVFDPENNIAHSPKKMQAYKKELEKKVKEARARYDAKDAECWEHQNDPELRYKLRDERRLLWIAMEESRNLDPEIKEQQRILDRHKQLAGFYEQHYRYLPEFEQAYRIFKEESAGDNPIQIADTMVALEMYKEASKHNPEELHQHFKGPVEGKEGNHPYTNQQFLDRSFHWIVNSITYEYNFLPGETPTSREQAERIAKRLVEEIPAEGFTGNTFLFGLADPKDHELVPRQSLLAE